jgi:hypothetical protein
VSVQLTRVQSLAAREKESTRLAPFVLAKREGMRSSLDSVVYGVNFHGGHR